MRGNPVLSTVSMLPAPPFCALGQGAWRGASVDAYERVGVTCAGSTLPPEMSASAVEEEKLVGDEAIERPEAVPSAVGGV